VSLAFYQEEAEFSMIATRLSDAQFRILQATRSMNGELRPVSLPLCTVTPEYHESPRRSITFHESHADYIADLRCGHADRKRRVLIGNSVCDCTHESHAPKHKGIRIQTTDASRTPKNPEVEPDASPNSLPHWLLSTRWRRAALSHGGCMRTRRAFAATHSNLRLPPGRL